MHWYDDFWSRFFITSFFFQLFAIYVGLGAIERCINKNFDRLAKCLIIIHEEEK